MATDRATEIYDRLEASGYEVRDQDGNYLSKQAIREQIQERRSRGITTDTRPAPTLSQVASEIGDVGVELARQSGKALDFLGEQGGRAYEWMRQNPEKVQRFLLEEGAMLGAELAATAAFPPAGAAAGASRLARAGRGAMRLGAIAAAPAAAGAVASLGAESFDPSNDPYQRALETAGFAALGAGVPAAASSTRAGLQRAFARQRNNPSARALEDFARQEGMRVPPQDILEGGTMSNVLQALEFAPGGGTYDSARVALADIAGLRLDEAVDAMGAVGVDTNQVGEYIKFWLQNQENAFRTMGGRQYRLVREAVENGPVDVSNALEVGQDVLTKHGDPRILRAVGESSPDVVVRRNVGVYGGYPHNPGPQTRAGHAYRGMTSDEYADTVGAGRGVESRGDWSMPGEGTSFARDFATAEDYVNYGRTDPRVTGQPTYLVEVSDADSLSPGIGGTDYLRAGSRLPDSRVTRVWEMRGNDSGEVVARLVRGEGNTTRTLDFDQAQELRSILRGELNKTRVDPLPRGERDALRETIDAITAGMEATTGRVSPDVTDALREADRFWSRGSDVFGAESVQRVLNSNPEQVYDALRSGGGDITGLRQLRRALYNTDYLAENPGAREAADQAWAELQGQYIRDAVRMTPEDIAAEATANAQIGGMQRFNRSGFEAELFAGNRNDMQNVRRTLGALRQIQRSRRTGLTAKLQTGGRALGVGGAGAGAALIDPVTLLATTVAPATASRLATSRPFVTALRALAKAKTPMQAQKWSRRILTMVNAAAQRSPRTLRTQRDYEAQGETE